MMWRKLLTAWGSLRRHFWLSLTFDVALLVLVFMAVHGWQTRDLPLNERAPQTALPMLKDAGLQSLVEPGDVGIVYFFAPWCGYCRVSIGNLDHMLDNGRVGWVRAVALDYSSEQEVQEFVTRTGLQAPVLMGGFEQVQNWQVRAFPTYYVIDAEGRIASRSVGYSTFAGMWWRAFTAR